SDTRAAHLSPRCLVSVHVPKLWARSLHWTRPFSCLRRGTEFAVNHSALVRQVGPGTRCRRMSRSDRDIYLMARLLKGRYGPNASEEAGRRADIEREIKGTERAR